MEAPGDCTLAACDRRGWGWGAGAVVAFEAAAYPPFCASFHVDPSMKALDQLVGACNTEVWPEVARMGRRVGTVGGRAGSRGGGTGFAGKQCSVIFSWSRRPFVVRSIMSAVSGQACGGMWSQGCEGLGWGVRAE